MIFRSRLSRALEARGKSLLDEYNPALDPLPRQSWMEEELEALRETVREQRKKIVELTIRLRDKDWDDDE